MSVESRKGTWAAREVLRVRAWITLPSASSEELIFSPCGHVAATWRSRGRYVAVAWRWRGGGVAVTWRLRSGCVVDGDVLAALVVLPSVLVVVVAERASDE